MTQLTLNLAYPANSDIHFEVAQFPDGQQSLTITDSAFKITDERVRIESRIETFRDLELIIAANQILRDMEARDVVLYVPYLLGARSDRKFDLNGGVNYLKQVICPVINSQGFDQVTVLDPHSDVAEACLTRYHKMNNFGLVKYALTDIDNRDDARRRICLVSPDAGAYKKVFDVAQRFEIENIITASKVRDLKTGKILRTELPNLHVADTDHELKYVIVDDICDGGRTFIELAKAIKERRPNAEIYLIVTHGIFSAGFSELGEYFTGIYCTNSVKDINDMPDDTDAERTAKQQVKQINVFS